jgi:hypothetical protein
MSTAIGDDLRRARVFQGLDAGYSRRPLNAGSITARTNA